MPGTESAGNGDVRAGKVGMRNVAASGPRYISERTSRPMPAHQYFTPRCRIAISPYGWTAAIDAYESVVLPSFPQSAPPRTEKPQSHAPQPTSIGRTAYQRLSYNPSTGQLLQSGEFLLNFSLQRPDRTHTTVVRLDRGDLRLLCTHAARNARGERELAPQDGDLRPILFPQLQCQSQT